MIVFFLGGHPRFFGGVDPQISNSTKSFFLSLTELDLRDLLCDKSG